MGDRLPPEDEKSAVARWSRRKQEAREIGDASDPSESQETAISSDQEPETRDQADVVAALPPIEGLTADSVMARILSEVEVPR